MDSKLLLKRLPGTRIFIGGLTHLDLADRKTIEMLKREQITKVFCTFPLTQKQFDGQPKDAKTGDITVQELFHRRGVNPLFPARLRAHGIGTSSLLISPKHMKEFRTYESFLNEARITRKNFLIACFGGWHTSGSYAMYYLAANLPLTLEQIHEKFRAIGYSNDDIKLAKNFFERSNIDIEKIVNTKLEKMKIAAQIEAIKRARKKKKKTPKRRVKLK